MLTQNRLKEALKYNHKSGSFIWRISRQGHHANRDAGNINSRGYQVITIDRKTYSAHRLAWLYHYGYMPENFIDHIDRDRLNNSIVNLREATRQCNHRNSGNSSANTSGVRGVCEYAKYNRWSAAITVDMKSIGLGWHKSFNEAVCHRLAAEQAEDWTGCDSSSPAYQHVKKLIPSIR